MSVFNDRQYKISFYPLQNTMSYIASLIKSTARKYLIITYFGNLDFFLFIVYYIISITRIMTKQDTVDLA